jgi:25S rRNA (uracil2634-N3)-methyltransferase
MGKAVRKSKSLSGALAAQQSRLKAKSASQAAAEQRAKQDAAKARSVVHGKGKSGKGKAPSIIVPFAPTDRILLVGEGAFSFAHALVCDPPDLPSGSYGAGPSNAASSSSSTLTFLPPANVVATALDTEEECYEKYPEAVGTVKTLRERGASVIFGVDATKLERCTALKGKRFDRVVWNFPHNGSGMADMDRNILAHQTMMLDFLASCPHVLREGDVPEVARRTKKGGDDEEEEMNVQEEMQYEKTWRGTVLITLRNVPPYTLWFVQSYVF